MAKTKSQSVTESRENAGLKSKSIYVTDADWSEIKAAAKAAGMSQSAYVMHAHHVAQAAGNGRQELQVNAAVATKLRKILAELEGEGK